MEGPDGEGTKSHVSLNPGSERGLVVPECPLGTEEGARASGLLCERPSSVRRVRDGGRCTLRGSGGAAAFRPHPGLRHHPPRGSPSPKQRRITARRVARRDCGKVSSHTRHVCNSGLKSPTTEAVTQQGKF